MQAYEGWKDEERSPIFHQFLDCVFQCLHQMPQVFEFNDDLLIFILGHTQSGWFGDFMFNCEREKSHFKDTYGGLSIWAVVLHNMDKFRNKNNYEPQVGAIMPVARLGSLVLWGKWFNRWNERLWRAAWIQQCHVDDIDDDEEYTTTTTSAADESLILGGSLDTSVVMGLIAESSLSGYFD
jgi:hypothetical protein